MKRTFSFALVFLLSLSVFSKPKFDYKMPDFDCDISSIEKKTLQIIDLYQFQEIPEYDIKFCTSYNAKGIFKVFAHNPESNKWIDFGNIDMLPGTYKKFKVKPKKSTESFATKRTSQETPLQYRYVAITSIEKFDYTFESDDYDLIVSVSKKESSIILDGKIYSKNFSVIDYKDIDAEDYFKFQNYTDFSDFNIRAFVFDAKLSRWILGGTAHLKSYADTDTVKPLFDDDIDDYRFLAVIIDKDFNFYCDFFEKNNDLYIQIKSNDTPENKNNAMSTGSLSDIKSELENLKKYFENGLIDESEYKEKKAKLLGL